MSKDLGDAVNRVRRQKHRVSLSAEEDRLKGSNYLWLQKVEDLPPSSRAELASLQEVAVKAARAWAIRQAGMGSSRYRSHHRARHAWLRWYRWAIQSRPEPIKRVARIVKTHLEDLVNTIHHGVMNARSEDINSRIQWIKYTVRGFRNRARFGRAIYFHLGCIPLLPAAVSGKGFHTKW